jgi:hypothetical protein
MSTEATGLLVSEEVCVVRRSFSLRLLNELFVVVMG